MDGDDRGTLIPRIPCPIKEYSSQNDAWACERNFIDRRSLEPGYEREPLPAEPGGVERVLRLVEEAFDRKRRAA